MYSHLSPIIAAARTYGMLAIALQKYIVTTVSFLALNRKLESIAISFVLDHDWLCSHCLIMVVSDGAWKGCRSTKNETDSVTNTAAAYVYAMANAGALNKRDDCLPGCNLLVSGS